jgi:hypothetical protein
MHRGLGPIAFGNIGLSRIDSLAASAEAAKVVELTTATKSIILAAPLGEGSQTGLLRD